LKISLSTQLESFVSKMNSAETKTTMVMANSSSEQPFYPPSAGFSWRQYLVGINGWQICAAILMILVAYDQCPQILSSFLNMLIYFYNPQS